MHTVVLKPFVHRNAEVIGIAAPYVRELDLAIRKLKGVKWSSTNKLWYVPLCKGSHVQIRTALQPLATIDEAALKAYLQKRKAVGAATVQAQAITGDSGNMNRPVKPLAATVVWNISAENNKALAHFIEQLKLKAYSASTLKTYRNEFLQLLQVLKKKPVNDLMPDDLRRYFVYCFEKLKLSENTLHSRINAIKFYFEQVMHREKFFWEIPRPKKELQNPKFFNQDEITAIIKSVGNLKHRTMLMLAYSAGLRVSEVVALKCRQIDSQRRCVFVEQAKGKKDRVVALSPVLLVVLREYWKAYRPDKSGFLFEGQAKGEPYTTRSLQLVLAVAKRKAGVIKPGSIHSLRHSFATHLLDKGTDVTMIMKLLGHNDLKTTMRYLHVTNRDLLQVMSPLDDLRLE